MARSINNELCLWLVKPDGVGLRRVRVSRRLANITAIVAGAAFGLMVCIFGDYVRIMFREGSNAYHIHRMVVDREKLADDNAGLRAEIDRLSSEGSKVAAYKQDVEKKIDELASVLHSAASLGSVSGSKAGSAFAFNSKQGRSGTGSSGNLDKLKDLNRGLGGAEIECRRDKKGTVACSNVVRREKISLSLPSNTDSVATKDDLVAKLENYIKALRVIPLGYPVSGEMTSGFGYRVSPFSHTGAIHEGIDLSVEPGTAVKVTGDGFVERVEYDGAYGWVIDVAHSDTMISRYAHLSRPLVKEGQVVTRGERIALSGSTGRSTGPHLHYEVRLRGRASDPTPLLALAGKLSRFL